MNPDEIKAVIDKWCPDCYDDEHISVRALRGLLNANACIVDLKLVLDGKNPIRPLENYP